MEQDLIYEQYRNLGLSAQVYTFGKKIEEKLKTRFEKIDQIAEYNQMKSHCSHAKMQSISGMPESGDQRIRI